MKHRPYQIVAWYDGESDVIGCVDGLNKARQCADIELELGCADKVEIVDLNTLQVVETRE